MKLRVGKKSRFKWDCAMKGHSPFLDTPQEVHHFGGKDRIGLVCQKCCCIYYQEVPDRQIVLPKEVRILNV